MLSQTFGKAIENAGGQYEHVQGMLVFRAMPTSKIAQR